MAIDLAVLFDEVGDLEHVVEILRANDSVDVDAQARMLPAAGLEGFERLKRLGEVARNGADRVLHLAKPVECDVQVEAELRILH